MTQNEENRTVMTLPSEREIVITRVFNAPRELVWKAWTQPEHVAQWWGIRGYNVAICEIDLRVGGRYRYVLQGDGNAEFGFDGEYREIVPPERLVYTDGFEGMPGHEALVTVTFTQENGKTKLTSHSHYQSVADRDGHIQSGMEAGMRETMDNLETYLTTMQ
jgi:uncharacterized protein YndB with AHSA1/START domain